MSKGTLFDHRQRRGDLAQLRPPLTPHQHALTLNYVLIIILPALVGSMVLLRCKFDDGAAAWENGKTYYLYDSYTHFKCIAVLGSTFEV